MRWFKHDTDTDGNPKIKLLKRKFGVEGLGIYFEINRLIAKNVEDNIQEWGFLPKEYTDVPELLADEICTDSVQKLHSVCKYCVEIGLLYTYDGRILNPKILQRADRYTEQKAKENSLKIEEYVQKLYRICTDSTQNLPLEENRIEKNRKENIRDLENRVSSKVEKKETPTPYKRVSEEKATVIQRIGYHYEDTCTTRITNWGKQAKAISLMIKAGYTEDEIKRCITYMATRHPFYANPQEPKGFDLTTVSNEISRLKAQERIRTV